MNKQYNWQDGQKRLDHYNAWLMDNTREFGKPYPGYPEDKNDSYSVKTVQKDQVLPVTVAKKSKKRYNNHIDTHTSKGSKMTKVTNLSRATDIVKESADKATAIAKIVEVLGVTRSNAFVYYTKASKALGQPAGVKAPKAEKVAKVKVNPVTETSPEKISK